MNKKEERRRTREKNKNNKKREEEEHDGFKRGVWMERELSNLIYNERLRS